MNSIWKYFWIAVGLVVLVSVVGWALGWVSLPFWKGSAQNVEAQFDNGYTMYTSLQSTARSVCTAQKAVDEETNSDLKSQRMTQLLAYQTNYARIEADYDKWARNIFQGKVVRPADLPYQAPTLAEMEQQVCSP